MTENRDQDSLTDLLSNKNILLICPDFFGYNILIKNELESSGAKVYSMNDRPFQSQLMRALTTKFPRIISFYLEYFFYRRHLKKLANIQLDYVFVINGQTLSSGLINSLRSKYRQSIFILYFWDSVLNRPNVLDFSHHFNVILTFDIKDAKNYGWNLRPLFFCNDFKISDKSTKCKFGLSFVATAHTDRFFIASKIFRQIENEFSVYKYLYLQAFWVYLIYKIFNKNMKDAKISDFKFNPLSRDKIREIFNDSLCILDIEHPNQSGLTIRTFEAMGAQKKLITTNQTIKSYDFYNEDNIYIIDRLNPLVPIDFLKKPYSQLPDSIYSRYSLSGWLNEIFLLSVK